MKTTDDKRVDADAVGDALADDILRDVNNRDREMLGGVIDEEMGREPPTWNFTEGAMAHLATFVEAIVGLPGDEPIYMRQTVELDKGEYWYRVEVKLERLNKATPPEPPKDFCEEDYPEHIYPEWMVTPPPIATVKPMGPYYTGSMPSHQQEALIPKTLPSVAYDKPSTWQDVALRERVANLCHNQWANWMHYLYEQGHFPRAHDYAFEINHDASKRWQRQMTTSYFSLLPHEQDSDRKEADKFIECLLIQGTSQ